MEPYFVLWTVSVARDSRAAAGATLAAKATTARMPRTRLRAIGLGRAFEIKMSSLGVRAMGCGKGLRPFPQRYIRVRLGDRAAEVRGRSSRDGDVAGRFGGRDGLVRREQVRRDAVVERHEPDLPVAAVIRPISGSHPGDAELAVGPVG